MVPLTYLDYIERLRKVACKILDGKLSVTMSDANSSDSEENVADQTDLSSNVEASNNNQNGANCAPLDEAAEKERTESHNCRPRTEQDVFKQEDVNLDDDVQLGKTAGMERPERSDSRQRPAQESSTPSVPYPVPEQNYYGATASSLDSQPHDPCPEKCLYEDARNTRIYKMAKLLNLMTNSNNRSVIKSQLREDREIGHANESTQPPKDRVEDYEQIILDSGLATKPLAGGLMEVDDIRKGCIKLVLKAKSSQGLKDLLDRYLDGRLEKELEERYTEEVQKKVGEVKLRVTIEDIDVEALRKKIDMLEKIENELQPEEFENSSEEISCVTFSYCEIQQTWFWCEAEEGTETPLSCDWLPLTTKTYKDKRPQEKYRRLMEMLVESNFVPPQDDHENCVICHGKNQGIEGSGPVSTARPTTESSQLSAHGDIETVKQVTGNVMEVSVPVNIQAFISDDNDCSKSGSPCLATRIELKTFVEDKLISNDPTIATAIQSSDIDRVLSQYADKLKPPIVGDYNHDSEQESKILETLGDLYLFKGITRDDSKCFVKAAALYNSALIRTLDEIRIQSICDAKTQNERAFQVITDRVTKIFPNTKTAIEKLRSLREQFKTECEEIWIKVSTVYRNYNDINLKEDMVIVAETRRLFKRISEDLKTMLRDMFHKCKEFIGSQMCEYALICTGSLACEDATPYMPISLAFIVSDELSKEDHQYFEQLWHTFFMAMLAFGETPLHMLAIKELNNLDQDGGNWFYDSICCSGFLLNSESADVFKPTILTTSQLSANLRKSGEDCVFIYGNKQVFEDVVLHLSPVDKQAVLKQVLLDITSLATEVVWERSNSSSPDEGCFSTINQQEIFRIPSIISKWLKAISDVTSSCLWDNFQQASAKGRGSFLIALERAVSIASLIKLMHHSHNPKNNLGNKSKFVVTDNLLFCFYSEISPFLSPTTLPEKMLRNTDSSNGLYKAKTSLRLLKLVEALNHLTAAERHYQADVELDLHLCHMIELDILLCRMEIMLKLWRNLDDIHSLLERISTLIETCSRERDSSHLNLYFAYFCAGIGFYQSECYGRAYAWLKKLNVLMVENISQFAKGVIFQQTAGCCYSLGYLKEARTFLLSTESVHIPECTSRGFRLSLVCRIYNGAFFSCMQPSEPDRTTVIMTSAIQIYKKYESVNITNIRDVSLISDCYIVIANTMFERGGKAEKTRTKEILKYLDEWIKHLESKYHLKYELVNMRIHLDWAENHEADPSQYLDAAFDYVNALLQDDARLENIFRINYEGLLAGLAKRGRIEDALCVCEKVVNRMKFHGFQNCKQYGKLAKTWAVITFNKRNKDQFRDALMYIKKSLKCFNNVFRLYPDVKEVCNLDVVHSVITLGDAYKLASKTGDAHTQYSEALRLLNNGKAVFSSNPRHVELLYHTARGFDSIDKAEQAYECYDVVLKVTRDIFPTGSEFEATALHKLGISCLEHDDNDKAIGYLKQAVKLFESLNEEHQHSVKIVKEYKVIANVYSSKDESTKAKKYLEKALALLKSFDSDEEDLKLLTAQTYVNLGATFAQLDNCDTAIENVEKGIAMYRKVHGQSSNDVQIVMALQLLGFIFLKNNDFENAHRCMRQAATMSSKGLEELGVPTGNAVVELLESLDEIVDAVTKHFQEQDVTKHFQDQDNVENLFKGEMQHDQSTNELLNMFNDKFTMDIGGLAKN